MFWHSATRPAAWCQCQVKNRPSLSRYSGCKPVADHPTGAANGSAADGTVRSGLDGTGYEIDLNARHAQELRSAPDALCDGCPAGGGPVGPPRAGGGIERSGRQHRDP